MGQLLCYVLGNCNSESVMLSESLICDLVMIQLIDAAKTNFDGIEF